LFLYKTPIEKKSAVGQGGPRREYFMLLLKAAANQNALFEGH